MSETRYNHPGWRLFGVVTAVLLANLAAAAITGVPLLFGLRGQPWTNVSAVMTAWVVNGTLVLAPSLGLYYHMADPACRERYGITTKQAGNILFWFGFWVGLSLLAFSGIVVWQTTKLPPEQGWGVTIGIVTGIVAAIETTFLVGWEYQHVNLRRRRC